MKNQLHAYADEELYAHCSVLADELGLSNSSFLKMLVSKAWNERKGEDVGKITDLPAVQAVRPAVVPGKHLKKIEVQDKEYEELTKETGPASKVHEVGGGIHWEAGIGRHRHKAKIQKE
jgi:hypothetical protein